MPPPSKSKPRGSLQRATVQADVGRIIEAYRRAGRSEVRVDPQIIDRGNGRVDLIYAITEGAKTPVRQIDFTGNKAFGKRQLSAVIKTSATHMLSFLTGGNVYDPDRVAQDQRTAAALLPQQGLCRRQRLIGKGRVRSRDEGFYAAPSQSTRARSIASGRSSVACNVPGMDCDKLRALPAAHPGALFDGNALDKTTEATGHRNGKARLSLCPGDPSPHRTMPPRNVSTSPS